MARRWLAALFFLSCAPEAPRPAPPSPECTSYCICMARTCAEVPEYPFAEAGTCHDYCADLTPDELTCFARSCTSAGVPGQSEGVATHLCLHAWGTFGLEECVLP
jgi:hypothetical protein